MNTITNVNCGRVLEKLDLYLDRELPAGEGQDLTNHLAECELCRQEMQGRRAIRDRVRSSVRSIEAAPELRDRILSSLPERHTSTRSNAWRQWSVGIAAAITVAFIGGISYNIGYLRWTTKAQTAYLGGLLHRVSAVSGVGLSDHVHCAFFRKYPTQAPPPEQIAADMGPEFIGLVDVIRENVPAEQRIVMAHRCSFRGRKFVHIAVADGKHLGSIVIAVRQPGETFRRSGLTPALSDSGLPVYHEGIQRFSIDGFETSGHLIYFISDMPREVNSRMFARMSKPIQLFVAKLES